MKILFFGYKSFAAQDLYDHLKKKNKNVFYFSRKEKKKKYFFDLTNKINLNYFNKKEKYTIIFFSSFVPQDEKVQNWKHVSKINIDGIIRFINNIKFQPVKIIYISSCSVYGNEKTKLSEKDHLKPITPYSISKLAQENLIRIFCKKNRLN